MLTRADDLAVDLPDEEMCPTCRRTALEIGIDHIAEDRHARDLNDQIRDSVTLRPVACNMYFSYTREVGAAWHCARPLGHPGKHAPRIAR